MSEDLYLRAKKAYYTGDPIMDDAEFDALENKLKASNSPVINMVGFNGDENKTAHYTPMLSLHKVQINDLSETSEKLLEAVKFLNVTSWIEASVKLDGLAFGLTYSLETGELITAATRGNGEHGIDKTELALAMNNIANKIVLPPDAILSDGILEIRGEIVMDKSIFAAKYAADSKNERNTVAGIVNRKELTDKVHDITFVAFELKVNGHHAHVDFSFLKDNGFNVINIDIVDAYGLGEIISKIIETRETYPYRIDGAVLKTSTSLRAKLGENDHHPKWAIAVKFPPEGETTTIESISWTLGIDREYTPVANLAPIELDGTTVKRASLHNIGYIIKNGTGPGAVVKIAKKGDIIPQVIEVVTKSEVDINDILPEDPCEIKGIHLMTTEDNPYAIQLRKLNYGMSVFDLDGVGGSTIEKLLEVENIEGILDIFNPEAFNKQTLIQSGNFKDNKTLDSFVSQVQNIKEVKYEDLIQCLCMDRCGVGSSKKIAEYESGLRGLEGIQHILREEIKPGGEMRIQIDYAKWVMDFANIDIIYPAKEVANGNMILEMTGSPKSAGFKVKSEFVNFAKSNGFDHGKLDTNCKYLLTDSYDSSSSKMAKAKKLGVDIITYEDFKNKF